MTTNKKWPEIQRMLKFLPGVDVVDAPDVVARVFKMKVDQLLDQIKNKNCFGRCIGVMHVIEFQKRGLPHAHMLIWLHPNDHPKITEQIDKMVSAEIPDPSIDPVGYEVVKNYMIHGPCGTDCVNSPCMVKGRCIKHFPKRYNSHTYFDDCGFPIYKRRKTGITVKKKGIDLDNRYVVPYNRDLLIRFQCHTNLEISSWRIFGFDIHSRWPSVERLPVHLPNDKHVSFKGSQILQEVFDNAGTKKSKLEAWFDANKTYVEASNLTYSEFPSKFTWHPQPGIWKQRKRGDVIGRLAEVHSSSGELLYLRMLLLRIKGAVYFDDLKTVNDHAYNSFHEACAALGILQNDQQWHEAIEHKIVLSIASCGIAVVLLPGGRTAHSRFHIPLKLDENCSAGNSDLENKTIADFSKWQLAVGDGKETNISLSPDTGEISRAILTPTNIVVDEINTTILEKIPGMVYTYLSQDSIDDASDDDNDFRSAFPVEYLNSINMPCIPKHELKLKVGVVVMLMRNLNQIMGLCNGTRMIVKSCRKNSIECEILCGSHVGTKHLIPRIEMIPSDTNWPFEFKRVQFPIQICYAMTINKSQGQSLDTVGLYLPKTAFSHGHIYVAISRVTRPEGLHILIDSCDGINTDITNNVVFEEVFYNLPSVDN
ncbi:uncharacterized protein LOC141714563 [Apium graveolens]|uniref:uncharacterized protein LOC141714563 n=1 Tax=Apium graveolens TaxID=4045 RepID=UPI003D7BB0BF